MTAPKRGDTIIAGFELVMIEYARNTVAPETDRLDSRMGGSRAIAAIVLAAAAVEAYLGHWAAFELPAITEDERRHWRGLGLPDLVKDILRTRFGIADAGGLSWFPGLTALHKVRTCITHYFPDWRPRGTWPPEIKGLVTGRLIKPSGDDTMDWTSRLYTPEVARDLVEYAARAMDGLREAGVWTMDPQPLAKAKSPPP
jgi:hypothetical protein